VRLGTHVLIIPYRDPIFTAKILATLDVLSGGRLILGAGVGWMAEEFTALGRDPFAERGAVTDEYLRAFKALWTEDNPRFDGKYVRVADIGFQPKPVQKPHPPIWIGGHTPPALRRAAELGDGWAPIGLAVPSLLQPPEMAAKIANLRALLRERGRAEDAVTVSLSVPLAFAENPGSPRPLLTGHPEQIAADLRQYQALGVRNFILMFPGGVAEVQEAMARFAREVVPLIPQD
jgi:probable F420-dependent oxidoreductase